jgi:hypothetical protein
MPRAFFLGAGASKADDFPLTRELLCALGHYLSTSRRAVKRGRELADFLVGAFGVHFEDLRQAAKLWKQHLAAAKGRPSGNGPPGGTRSAGVAKPPEQLPHLTDILSALDILLMEEGGLGIGPHSSRALKGEMLRKAREQVATAIAEGFNELHRVWKLRRERKPMIVDDFARAIGTGDVLVTTNWDILLDEARDHRFGTTGKDYGTDIAAIEARKPGDDRKQHRPLLLKLHGSLNWLYCPRCSSLRIDVRTVTAHDGYKPEGETTRRSLCDCGMRREAVLVTPTFLKSYRNRHLLNIWTTAQSALADCGEWVFIGYSLPDDDIHIKTLLLKAKRMRADKHRKPVKVTVVTDCPDSELGKRYRRLFGADPMIHHKGFAEYVRQLEKDRPKLVERAVTQRGRRRRVTPGRSLGKRRKRRLARLPARGKRGRESY